MTTSRDVIVFVADPESLREEAGGYQMRCDGEEVLGNARQVAASLRGRGAHGLALQVGKGAEKGSRDDIESAVHNLHPGSSSELVLLLVAVGRPNLRDHHRRSQREDKTTTAFDRQQRAAHLVSVCHHHAGLRRIQNFESSSGGPTLVSLSREVNTCQHVMGARSTGIWCA